MNQSYLKSQLKYWPSTGAFRWKSWKGGRRRDLKVSAKGSPYVQIGIDGRIFYGHRLAFLYMTGRIPREIDHINGNKCDNRWMNLRGASRSQNSWNTGRKMRELPRGVYNNNNCGFYARICVNYKCIYLGNFPSPEAAARAYNLAQQKYHGEFARGAK